MTAILLYGLVALFDGVSIGSGDFAHLPRTNFLSMVLCIVALATVQPHLPRAPCHTMIDWSQTGPSHTSPRSFMPTGLCILQRLLP